MKIVVKIENWKRATGHRPQLSGGGKHHDRRLKRLKTRSASFRNAIKD